MFYFFKKKEPKLPTEYILENSKIKMEFDREGKILALTDKAVNHCYSMIASNSIESFSIQELSSIQKDTSIEFEKKLYSTNGRTSVLKEKYTLGDKSISLDILIESAYPFWTQDIITKIQYEVSKQTRFWTAWSDPFQKNSGWHDPRVFLPFFKSSVGVLQLQAKLHCPNTTIQITKISTRAF